MPDSSYEAVSDVAGGPVGGGQRDDRADGEGDNQCCPSPGSHQHLSWPPARLRPDWALLRAVSIPNCDRQGATVPEVNPGLPGVGPVDVPVPAHQRSCTVARKYLSYRPSIAPSSACGSGGRLAASAFCRAWATLRAPGITVVTPGCWMTQRSAH